MSEDQEELSLGKKKSDKTCEDEKESHDILENLQRKRRAVQCDSDLIVKSANGGDALSNVGASGMTRTPSHMTEDMLQSQAQTLIDEVNRKRQRDTESIEDYKNCQIQQVEKFCSQIESHLFETYKVQNKAVDEKIQQLFATLERIAKVRAELEQFREVLDNLYKDFMP